MRKILLILFLFISSISYGQIFTQAFVDRCTGDVKIVTANFSQGSATVAFYNKIRTFTYQEFISGELQQWLVETYDWWNALSPCSAATQQAQQAQQTAQVAQQAAQTAQTAAATASSAASTATSAASTAATAATSVPTTPPVSTPATTPPPTETPATPPPTETPASPPPAESTPPPTEGSGSTETPAGGETQSETTGGGETTESKTEETKTEETKTEETKTEEKTEETKSEESSEEGGEESSEESSEEKSEEESSEDSEEKEEEKSEEKEEEKKEEKKENKKVKVKKFNPIQVKADMMAMQTMLGSYDGVMSFGASQTSLFGDTTYGLNGMVWSNLRQFSLNGSYSKVNMVTPDVLTITHGDHTHYGTDGFVSTRSPLTPPTPYLASIDAFSVGYSNNFGNGTIVMSANKLKPFGKWGTAGIGFSLANMFGEKKYQMSILGYNILYTNIVNVSPKVTYAPAIIWTQSPFMTSAGNPIYQNDLKGTKIGGIGILANSFTLRLTRRFTVNAGWTLIKGTDKNMPLMNSFMIGSKLPF